MVIALEAGAHVTHGGAVVLGISMAVVACLVLCGPVGITPLGAVGVVEV